MKLFTNRNETRISRREKKKKETKIDTEKCKNERNLFAEQEICEQRSHSFEVNVS